MEFLRSAHPTLGSLPVIYCKSKGLVNFHSFIHFPNLPHPVQGGRVGGWGRWVGGWRLLSAVSAVLRPEVGCSPGGLQLYGDKRGQTSMHNSPRLTFSHQSSLHVCFWAVGWSRSSWNKPAQTWREYAKFTEGGPGRHPVKCHVSAQFKSLQ